MRQARPHIVPGKVVEQQVLQGQQLDAVNGKIDSLVDKVEGKMDKMLEFLCNRETTNGPRQRFRWPMTTGANQQQRRRSRRRAMQAC